MIPFSGDLQSLQSVLQVAPGGVTIAPQMSQLAITPSGQIVQQAPQMLTQNANGGMSYNVMPQFQNITLPDGQEAIFIPISGQQQQQTTPAMMTTASQIVAQQKQTQGQTVGQQGVINITNLQAVADQKDVQQLNLNSQLLQSLQQNVQSIPIQIPISTANGQTVYQTIQVPVQTIPQVQTVQNNGLFNLVPQLQTVLPQQGYGEFTFALPTSSGQVLVNSGEQVQQTVTPVQPQTPDSKSSVKSAIQAMQVVTPGSNVQQTAQVAAQVMPSSPMIIASGGQVLQQPTFLNVPTVLSMGTVLGTPGQAQTTTSVNSPVVTVASLPQTITTPTTAASGLNAQTLQGLQTAQGIYHQNIYSAES